MTWFRKRLTANFSPLTGKECELCACADCCCRYITHIYYTSHAKRDEEGGFYVGGWRDTDAHRNTTRGGANTILGRDINTNRRKRYVDFAVPRAFSCVCWFFLGIGCFIAISQSGKMFRREVFVSHLNGGGRSHCTTNANMEND